MNRLLTEKIRAEILNLGMDLVGFAPVERWKEAPYLLSPPAILPESKSVIVAGIHITDTWTEMGGTPEPQDRSPGGWLDQNGLMDRIAFRIVRMLNDHGHQAIAVVSSNIWRYRQYQGIPSLFAPDLSHIHAAAAAGLAEIGWSGLAITPEFGGRVRFFSIVTDAELVPTPMYDGPKLCDMCGMCIRCCPSGAMRRDLNSQKPHVVRIGTRTFRYANKNIWRCAWAEHFNLDLNSPTLDDTEHIDETVILKELKDAGIRSHERGVCQKVCIPPHLRSDKPSFGRNLPIAMNRINKRYPDSMPTLRKMRDDIAARAVALGAELVSVRPLDVTARGGKLVESDAPGMKSIFGIAFRIPEFMEQADHGMIPNAVPIRRAYNRKMHFMLLRLGRMIEDYGYHAAQYTIDNLSGDHPEMDLPEQAGIGRLENGVIVTPEFGRDVMLGCLATDAVLEPTPETERAPESGQVSRRLTGTALRRKLEYMAEEQLMTLFGVAPAERLDHLADQLKRFVNEKELSQAVRDANPAVHGAFVPEIIDDRTRLRRPADFLPGARSVIMIGTHFNDEVVRNVALDRSQQIGCYGFLEFQVPNEIRFAAIELGHLLQSMGYRYFITDNLLGIGSRTDTARGQYADMRSNALEAVAAGLGELGEHGALLTAEHGPHQRMIAIVTDAEIPANELKSIPKICIHCHECRNRCMAAAFTGRVEELDIDGIKIRFPEISRHRCDWAKRYSLLPEEGPGIIGNITDVKMPSGPVSIEDIAAACRSKDPIMKTRTCVYERCLRHCPAGENSAKRLPPER